MLATVRPERALDSEWDTARPAILGALLDAVSTALRDLDATKIDNPSRMADAEQWIMASGAVPKFRETYAANRTDASRTEIDSSLFATTLLEFVLNEGEWEGTPTALLAKINAKVESKDRGKGWPGNARAAGDAVRKHGKALRQAGLEVDFRRSHGVRQIVLSGAKVEQVEPEANGGIAL